MMERKKYNLNNVGAPDCLDMGPDFMRPTFAKQYVNDQFRDLVAEAKVLQKVTYKKGRKVLYKFEY